MTKYFTFLIPLVIIFSCSKNDENKIIGTWFNTECFEYPLVYIFAEDSFYYPYESYRSINIYKTKDDTLLFQGCYDVGKLKYEINEDTLVFKNLKTDSIYSKYKKGRSLTEHWNDNLDLSLNIPTLTSYEYFRLYDDNIIILDDDLSDSIYLNGEKLKLDSNLYVRLIPKNPDNLFLSDLKTKLFIDGDIMMEKVKFLQYELSKAHLRQIEYITYDTSANLSQTSSLLPFEYYTYPDSLKDKFPPLPPKYEIPEFSINTDHFCIINEEGITVNNRKLTFKEFKNDILENLNSFRPFTMFIYYDNGLSYRNYIWYFFEIRKIFYDKRIEYASEKYDVDNYYGLRNLDNDQREEIWGLFPMDVYIIDREEYDKIKNTL